MKLLLVEDEERLARVLTRGLTEEGHQVDACARGDDAAEQARLVDYDVIVLDWMLPDRDGLAVLREWRRQGLRTPVLMLTARGAVGERVAGLRAGADDYLPKPFDFEELLARLEALHRRGGALERARRAGDVTLDDHRRVLVREGREVSLTGREYALCRELYDRAGEVLTRSELLARVWGTNFDGEPNIVDVYVGYLRRKLERIGAAGVAIQTVRGVGFRLDGADGEAGA